MLNIITRCTRPGNLLQIFNSIQTNLLQINWWVVFDTSSIGTIDISILENLNKDWIKIRYGKSQIRSWGYNLVNDILDEICDGWVYILDDDNLLHENFYEEIIPLLELYPEKEAIIFNQKVEGKDFSKVDIRLAKPENIKVGLIDLAQFIIHIGLYGNRKRFNLSYTADGELIEKLWQERPEEFIFIDKELSYYNKLVENKFSSYPRILVVGTEEEIKLQSIQGVDYEAKDLNLKFIKDETNLIKTINNFNPDAILSVGENWNKFHILSNQSIDIRKRWLHVPKLDESIGNGIYYCANNYILNSKDSNLPLISFFTPIYNTGEKLWRTYESVKNQTYTNWEWVLVNDSTDDGKTLKIAEEIMDLDCRVKVYDFKKKSGGIVGESKFRAAVLSNGEYLMELDHDDYLLPEAGYWMVEGFKQYPDVKFVYSDCAEIWENGESITYGDGFSFGYGSYRDETWNEKIYKAMNTSNINPKTIRHIVGVPNHFRAWDRKFYLSIGGHNRRLTIADDYELIVRTFLQGRMLRIPKMLYLQYYHGGNTQDKTRADIQRRVRSIREFYNQKIYERFIELGVEDWAYLGNNEEPLFVESKFGDEENYVNYIFEKKLDIGSINYNNVLNWKL